MLKAGSVWALGAMSGTSLDGVDTAMVLTDGQRILEFGHTAYREYTAAQRDLIRSGFGLWQNDAGVEAVAEEVEAAHAAELGLFEGAEIVGFHGQTLAHDPGQFLLQVHYEFFDFVRGILVESLELFGCSRPRLSLSAG